jgi:hypothetical protein
MTEPLVIVTLSKSEAEDIYVVLNGLSDQDIGTAVSRVSPALQYDDEAIHRVIGRVNELMGALSRVDD